MVSHGSTTVSWVEDLDTTDLLASYTTLLFWPGRLPPQLRQFHTDFSALLFVWYPTSSSWGQPENWHSWNRSEAQVAGPLRANRKPSCPSTADLQNVDLITNHQQTKSNIRMNHPGLVVNHWEESQTFATILFTGRHTWYSRCNLTWIRFPL